MKYVACNTQKTTQKLHSYFKMADFLFNLGYGSKRLFCTSRPDTWAHQVSYMEVKVEGGANEFCG